jgi:hypothetical protein
MSWPFHKAMELPGDDPRLVQYLKAHHAKWKAAKENDKIETIKDKIIDGLTEGVYSQDYTQLVAKELDEEIAETEKQPAKQDKKSNPQLERLEKMGKAWGKDQMSVLRELGKTNPQGLKDELDRIDSERERTTKAHKEWLKEKTAKQQPAKKAERPAKEEKNDHTERDLNKIPISQMTPAEKKYMWDLEQKKYKETQKNIAKDTIVGLRKMIEKTNKLIANFEKDGQQAEVDGLIGYRDELEKSIKEITKIHRL